MASTTSSDNKFIDEIFSYPTLSAEEEMELARRIQNGDEEALQKLIKGNLRHVVSISRKYAGSGIPMVDLINEGVIGLMEAARRYDPDRGVKFITYAVWWIRQAILYAISQKGNLVKLPPKTARLLNAIRITKSELTQKLGRPPTVAEVASALKISEEAIENAMKVSRVAISLENNIDGQEIQLHSGVLQGELAKNAEELVIEDLFADEVELLLACLDEREKAILKMHYGFEGEPLTLQQIGDKFGLTRERIRQIEGRAIKKLKRIAKRKRLQDFLKK